MTEEGRRRPGFPVARVVASGLTGCRLQTIVIGLVLLISTGTCMLALTLLADSGAPFDRALAARRGAEVAAAVDLYVTFVVAFCVIGLVLSVLIVTNVVSGAVVAGYTRIGILKSIGFTPGQVVAAYTALGLAPAAAGCLGGVLLGNWLAGSLLSRAAYSYGVGMPGVPAWVDAAGPALMCGLTAIAAVVPALRAGRLNTVRALAAGRAPAGHGYAAHRLMGRLPLPRPVTMGLAAPFARPARTAATLAAVLLGTTAVTFAVGLNTSLDRMRASIDLPLRNGVSSAISRMLWLIGGLSVLLAIAAALGVLSTVLLQTRERRHDLGVFRAVGMTPRQAVAMVVCSAAAAGLAAGMIAVPAGIALHHYVLPRIGAVVGTGLPASFLNVYGGVDVLELTLAGLIIAVAGALLPAGLAARIPVSSALRAE